MATTLLSAAALWAVAAAAAAQATTAAPWQVAGRVLVSVPGPLERMAALASPERPIPHRLYLVEPVYPAEAASLGITATVRVRLVVDAGGFVAEARLSEAPVLGAYPATPQPDDRSRLAGAFDALATSALDAVRQWRYDAPVAAPMAFDVTLSFTSAGEARTAAALPRQAADDTLGSSSPMPEPVGPVPEWAEGIPRVGGPVRPPRRLTHVAPRYPGEARAAGITGRVILQVRIEADGRIVNARILESVPAFDASALEAVKQWRYAPPMVDGVPSPVLMNVVLQFSAR